MSAEEDTELRDLLVQTLENSGVLNKIKAELRAAVFLALEEQERVENKTPLVNESLKKFLNTKDGRLVAGLVTEFLQFFNLDFTLAVFQPETNTFTGLDGRDNLARELGIYEGNELKGAPLLLEVMRQGQQKEKDNCLFDELTAKHIAEAKKKFEFYDKDKNGEISKEELRELFIDLFPHFHKNMLDRYVNEEFKAVDKDFNQVIDFDEFLGMYKRLFIQCRSVVAPDATDMVQSPRKLSEGRQTTLNTSSKDEEIPRYKGTGKVKENGEKADEKITDNSLGDTGPISGDVKSSSNLSSGEPKQEVMLNTTTNLPELKKDEKLYLDDEDSFFDDPLPEQMKIYGWRTDLNSKPTSGLTSLSDAPPLTVNLGSLAKAPPLKEADIKGTRDEEEYYDDDFVSGSQRSDKTKSEVSIGEEIEEDISVEGEDLCTDDQLDDFTLDHTISHCSDVADYIEEVAK
ncbi:FGFR1 oncogene partner isoform X3 [Scyliorhinus canicula]|uniref:FGFR1 oncogene partner isoform X3 n=1 Tax=Scyliorhinus canicula TaxID=7830 RepID=UPI0018F5C3D7|nr:FGFR1 oncogene partner isoform X3 [Scyliorhinus canicula]